jgi:PPOX class probable FMN-dependent enzyme
MNSKNINALDHLQTLFDPPTPYILRAKLDYLDVHAKSFLAVSPLFFLATSGATGLDCSPRGGPAGFVEVSDEKNLIFPDWRGNNKIESLKNIVGSGGEVGMVFLVPKYEAFLRINGLATLTNDPDVLQRFIRQDAQVKLAVQVSVREVFFHCAKAINRSHLWSPEQWVEPQGVASVGQVLRDHAQITDVSAQTLTDMYSEKLKIELY